MLKLKNKKVNRYFYDLYIYNYLDTYYDDCSIAHATSKKAAFHLAQQLLPLWKCDIVVKREPRYLYKSHSFKSIVNIKPEIVKKFKY